MSPSTIFGFIAGIVWVSVIIYRNTRNTFERYESRPTTRSRRAFLPRALLLLASLLLVMIVFLVAGQFLGISFQFAIGYVVGVAVSAFGALLGTTMYDRWKDRERPRSPTVS